MTCTGTTLPLHPHMSLHLQPFNKIPLTFSLVPIPATHSYTMRNKKLCNMSLCNLHNNHSISLLSISDIHTLSYQSSYVLLNFTIFRYKQTETGRQKHTKTHSVKTMDKDHLLVCPKLDHTSKELRKLYWETRRLME